MSIWDIVEWSLIIVIGIPLIVVVLIPLTVYLASKSKRLPSFTFLLNYFGVDISQPPYSEWMEKSPILFIGLTSIEIYISYYLVKLVRGTKWVVLKTIGFFKWFVERQWAEWDKRFEEEEKENKRRRG